MNDKQLQLVNFEQAKRLKKCGFDYPLKEFYNIRGDFETEYQQSKKNWNIGIHFFSAPPVALALKWFRDVKGITYEIEACGVGSYTCRYVNARGEFVNANGGKVYNNYEAAESALLDELSNLTEKENEK